MHVFISHSSKNAEVAKKICDYIEKNGKKCFLAPRDIRSGKEYAEEIVNGIDQSESMILIMSEAANHSPHVLREVERAVSKSIPILVYRIEEVELTKSMEYFLMTHQWSEAKIPEDYSKIWEFVCGQENNDIIAKAGKRHRKLWVVLALLLLLVGAGTFRWIDNSSGQEAFVTPYQVGDTVVFGSYLGEAIEWRVLRLTEDGTEAVLVAKNILTMKAFDAAESGAYNQNGEEDYWAQDSPANTDLELQRRVRGNNDWSVSNIRTWLNSADEVVTYADQAPMASAMSEKQAAASQDTSKWYSISMEEYNLEEYSWWLRQPVEGTTSACYLVGNGYTEENIFAANVGLEGYGIRPALTVDLQAEGFDAQE